MEMLMQACTLTFPRSFSRMFPDVSWPNHAAPKKPMSASAGFSTRLQTDTFTCK